MVKPRNVLEIEIPEILYQRMKTGIEWFDSILTEEGGLVPSMVYMVSGTPGAGKSTLIRQVADALTSSDAIVVYNACEESHEQIAIAATKMKLSKGFLLVTITSHVELVKALSAIEEAYPGKRVVLVQDSVQKLTRDGSPIEATDAIREWCKSTLHTAIVICQVTKSGSFRGTNDILHAVDVHIEMKLDKKSLQRTLHVTKNRMWQSLEEGVEYLITSEGVQCVASEMPDYLSKVDAVPKDERVRVNRRGPPKMRGKVGCVVKRGRTRLTVRFTDGSEVYLPKDNFDEVAA